MEQQVSIPTVIAELVSILLRKGVITQADLDNERVATLKELSNEDEGA